MRTPWEKVSQLLWTLASKYLFANQNTEGAASQMGNHWEWEKLASWFGRESPLLCANPKLEKPTPAAQVCHTGSVSLLCHAPSCTCWTGDAGRIILDRWT